MIETKPIEGITLKHLAPYLAYGLKGMVNGIERELVGHSYTSLELARKNGGTTTMCKYDQFQPLLRSLSDLTKEIEVNGKMFVPMQWFENESYIDWDHIKFRDYINPLTLPYCWVQKLLEWNFDIFGLLDKNLAVNINDIQK